MKLTKREIARFTYEGSGSSRDVRWSDDVPGFGVRIYPSGKKSFVLSYRHKGKKRLASLGSCAAMSLPEANAEARKLIGEVIKGEDPLAKKKRDADTVATLCDRYLNDYAKAHKKSWKDDERRIRTKILPSLGALKIEHVTDDDIEALHKAVGKTAIYEANRLLSLISAIFSFAKQKKLVKPDFVNPATSIKPFKEKSRDRWVDSEELPRLIEAIDNESNPHIRGVLWMYLLTGARKNELLSAEWDNVNWPRQEIVFIDTKTGNDHAIPLSTAAIEVLQQVPRIEGNPYIFCGAKNGAHLVNINKAWYRARAAAGLDDVRLHDLRRTVGSWLVQSGNSLHLVGKVLNHKHQSTTAIYAHFATDQVREAIEAHGQQVLGVAGKKEKPQVVQIKPNN